MAWAKAWREVQILRSSGAELNVFHFGSQLKALRQGQLQWRSAGGMLQEMQMLQVQLNDVILNTAIDIHGKGTQWTFAFHLLDGMPRDAMQPDVIGACACASSLRQMAGWRRAMVQLAVVEVTKVLCNAVLRVMEVQWRAALWMFQWSLSKISLDTISYSAVLGAYASGGLWIQCFQLLKIMAQRKEIGAPALEAANKALVLLEELNDKSRMIAATKYAIRSHLLLRQNEEALQAAANAVDHWRRSGDMENLLEMLEVQIQALLDLEVPDEALPLAQEAVKVAKRTKKKKLEGQALASLAQVQQAREEHVEALSASKEAIVIFRELGDQVAEAGARHAAVSAYMGRKKLGEALDEAKKARAIFRKHGLRHDEGRALLVKSCAHKMAQELGEAVQDATEAQYLFQKEKDRRWEAKALHDVAELQAMRENFPAAMRAAKKAEQLVQETTDKSNIAAVLSTVAQIHLSNMVAEISKAPREEPDFQMIEETVQAGWRARDAAHSVYEEEKSERAKALLAPIAFLLAQTFLAVKDADEAMQHVQEGEVICQEGQDETGQIIGYILRSYVAILRHDMLTAKKEAENANAKSKDIGDDFGVSLCEGIFDLVESSKDADGGIPSAPPSTMMPTMPDMPMGMPNMPKPRGPMPRPPGGGMAPMAPGAPSAAPAAVGKPKIEPEMVKVQIQDVATSLVGDDNIAADTPLMDAGLDSLSMVEFRNELLKEFPGISLPGALLFDYPTVNALRDFIYQTLMDS